MFYRRKLLLGTAAIGGALLPFASSIAYSQDADFNSAADGIKGILLDAQKGGLLSDEESTIGPISDEYSALYQITAAIDELESNPSNDPLRDILLDQLYAGLGRLNFSLKSPPAQLDEDEAAPQYTGLKSSYIQLFESCQIPPERKGQVDWHIDRITKPIAIARYRAVEGETGVPWYFIGIVHALEASFNFRGHLHNGDPLDRRTRQVPSGRPRIWNPPSNWESSAIDALRDVGNNSDWSIPRMLYLLEGYNGYGYQYRRLKSPYLWSFSNHFSKGKFVRDGVFDPSAGSKQCGAGVMLKAFKLKNLI
ncbi:hypothetical protein [Rhizobium laguerreae]|uniref:hypothetical protein n=1 Tax=Rhizobium laguerreae TaxID=1076926 RepID=UPI001C90D701|nr:hypothetical protein [Rhizobium laguerreae]MBY3198220.1 hypothetical protein [Rhizobium laguerreae]